MFGVRIYDPEYSYKNLVSKCGHTGDAMFSAKQDPYELRVDLHALNHKLNELDKATIHRRKQDLDHLYWVRS